MEELSIPTGLSSPFRRSKLESFQPELLLFQSQPGCHLHFDDYAASCVQLMRETFNPNRAVISISTTSSCPCAWFIFWLSIPTGLSSPFRRIYHCPCCNLSILSIPTGLSSPFRLCLYRRRGGSPVSFNPNRAVISIST